APPTASGTAWWGTLGGIRHRAPVTASCGGGSTACSTAATPTSDSPPRAWDSSSSNSRPPSSCRRRRRNTCMSTTPTSASAEDAWWTAARAVAPALALATLLACQRSADDVATSSLLPGASGAAVWADDFESGTLDAWSAVGKAGVCPSGADFFAAMLVAESSGSPGPVRFYTYYPGMAREPDGVTCWGRYGDGVATYTPPLTLSAGEWHRVEFSVQLDT